MWFSIQHSKTQACNEADRLWASTPQSGGVLLGRFFDSTGRHVLYKVHLNEPQDNRKIWKN